jgi:transposase-like protein
VARRYGISSGLLYTWRRHLLEGSLGVTRQPVAEFARVEVMAVLADPTPALSSVPEPAAAASGPMKQGVSREWGYDDTEGTVGRVDSRPGERGCDGCCG